MYREKIIKKKKALLSGIAEVLRASQADNPPVAAGTSAAQAESQAPKQPISSGCALCL